jgi:hypothetical protein
MAAVISRVNTLLKQKHAGVDQDLLLAHTYIDEAWRRARRNARQIDDNLDRERKQVAEMICESEGYRWSTNV